MSKKLSLRGHRANRHGGLTGIELEARGVAAIVAITAILGLIAVLVISLLLLRRPPPSPPLVNSTSQRGGA